MKTATNAKRREFLRASGQILSGVMAASAATAALADTAKPTAVKEPAVKGSKKLYLIESDPAGFKSLAGAELLKSGNNWAPLALVDGKLFIRDQKNLKVVQVGQ